MEAKLWSIIIPAYNEEGRIVKSLETVLEYRKKNGLLSEIIIVDDGSTDKTTEMVRKFLENGEKIRLLTNGRNMGKGYSVRRGVLAAEGEYILFSDADLSTPINEMESLRASLNNGFDIAIGSRNLPESDIKVHQKWFRERLGKLFGTLSRKMLGITFKDSQCGFKAFRRDAARDIFKSQMINGFAFDVEVLAIANKAGYKVNEVPVSWINSPESKLRPGVQSFKIAKELFQVWLRKIFRRY